MAAKWPADKVERWSLDRLIPYATNARTHTPEQVDRVAASISEWGWTVPILADEHGGVIAGHARILAARKLGLSDAPVMVATGWTQAQKRAYVLADNQLAINGAGWDESLLRVEMADLRDMAFDLSLIGFGDDEQAGLLADKTEGLTDPDDAPEPPEHPVSVLGDLWILGRHSLLCGDGTDISAVQRICNGDTPEISVCDPPYGISVVKGSSIGGAKPFGKVEGGKPHPFAGKRVRVHGPAKKAIIQPGVYSPIIGDDTTETAIAAYHTLMALGVSVIVLWGGNYFANALPPSRCWLVWDKENTGTFADAELAWTNQDRVVRLIRHQWSGLIKASERGERRVHPTQKPVALAGWVIDTIAPQAASVIDLFLGSGSTMIAAENRKIACFGVELSPSYVDVAVKRWQDFTGLSATLDGDGRTFGEIEANRAAVPREADAGDSPLSASDSYPTPLSETRERPSSRLPQRARKGSRDDVDIVVR